MSMSINVYYKINLLLDRLMAVLSYSLINKSFDINYFVSTVKLLLDRN